VHVGAIARAVPLRILPLTDNDFVAASAAASRNDCHYIQHSKTAKAAKDVFTVLTFRKYLHFENVWSGLRNQGGLPLGGIFDL
jgi:hypothetical protein